MSEISKQTPRPPASDFQKSSRESASSPAPENLKFEREDWTLFRTVEGLQQKAGVPKSKLRRLVLKELADNAHDTGTQVRIGNHGGGYFIENDGAGIDGTPAEIARAFSIARPLVSTKLLRLPTRGALGNGLRVGAGAVLASGGSLTVITCDRRIELRPERDGTTRVVRATKVKFPIGTRIEVSFGPALPPDQGALLWAETACLLAQGTTYSGRSSPWWYDLSQFQELLYASGDRPVRELIANLDGCTGAKASEIVAVAGLSRAICKKLAEHDEPVTIFCAHDADAYGTMIYQTFQEETTARSARKIRIVNLGLEPWEAIDMGLDVETVETGDRRKAVADYVRERKDRAPDCTRWEEWQQTHRIELNAMTTPQFIAWLDRKMAAHGGGKLIPPSDVLESDLEGSIERKIRAAITERVLREANINAQVTAALADIQKPRAATLTEGVKKLFEDEPESEWRDYIETVAIDIADAADDGSTP